MSNDAQPVTVLILDKEYRIACPEEEKSDLMQSARFLDDKMREIRNGGKVIGTDRIAVMAALNIAHELMQQQSDKLDHSQTLNKRIQRLQEKIEVALNQGNQLEL